MHYHRSQRRHYLGDLLPPLALALALALMLVLDNLGC
jgi:hypothetical protein